MNLSVGLPVDHEMYVLRDTSLFAAPARPAVVEMARVALALEIRLVPSGVSTIVLSISACFQTFITSHLCAMTSIMLSTAFRIPLSRSLLLSPSRVCTCRHVNGPDVSQPTSMAPQPCVDDVVIRIVDSSQVTSGLFFLSRSRSARQLSRSRSVTRAQQRDNSKHTVWSEV